MGVLWDPLRHRRQNGGLKERPLGIGTLCHSSCGGSTRIAMELAAEFGKRGHEVHVFCRTLPFGYEHEQSRLVFHRIADGGTDHPGALYIDWTKDELRALVDCVIDAVIRYRLDVLHFHYALPFAPVSARIKEIMGSASPLVVGTLHGTDVTMCISDAKKRAQLSHALEHVDVLTTVSQSHALLAAGVLELCALPYVIPNFVDLSKFAPCAVSKSPLVRGDKPKIAHVSNFRPVKNVESVARIFVEIRRRMDAELWLIGDGPRLPTLKAALDQSPFRESVHYWGIQRQVAPILQRADLLLIASEHESFSLVALEAMASGVPVVATKTGGLPEVVLHGATGFLFPCGDTQSAASYAVDILSRPGRLDAMRQAAAEQATRFDIRRISSIYEMTYFNHLDRLAATVDSCIGLSANGTRQMAPAE